MTFMKAENLGLLPRQLFLWSPLRSCRRGYPSFEIYLLFMVFIRLRKTVLGPDTYQTIQYEVSIKDTIPTSALLAL